MNTELLEAFLKEIAYSKTEGNLSLINRVLKKYEFPDQLYRRIPTLIAKIEKCKGFVGISNSNELLKIDYSGEDLDPAIKQEFYSFCESWAKKYKIEIEYCPEKDLYYISPKQN